MIKILPQIILGLWGIAPGNYSGITHVKDNVYAIVDDKDPVDGFKLLTLNIDSVNGRITNACIMEPSGMNKRRAEGVNTDRDCEGVAFFNDDNTVFVSGENCAKLENIKLGSGSISRSAFAYCPNFKNVYCL